MSVTRSTPAMPTLPMFDTAKSASAESSTTASMPRTLGKSTMLEARSSVSLDAKSVRGATIPSAVLTGRVSISTMR